MGWTGQYNWLKPSDVRKDIEKTWNKSENWKISKIASKSFGKRVWLLVENLSTAQREIILYLVDNMGDNYGYKDMSEDMGPNYYDCPIAFLEAAGTPKSDYAVKWREKVKNYHASSSRKFFEGDTVKIYNHMYEVWSVKKRNTYLVKHLGTGRVYRANAGMMEFNNGLDEARNIAKAK